MPDKKRLIKLLVEYGITDRFIDDLCDEIEECFAPVIEKAEKWDEWQAKLEREKTYQDMLPDEKEPT